MALNKREAFQKGEIELADFAKALSHPARVAILKALAKHESCVCGEIVEVLPLAQSTVSQHLKELLSAGLVKGNIDGNKICYCINWQVFEKFTGKMNDFFAKSKALHTKNCC